MAYGKSSHFSCQKVSVSMLDNQITDEQYKATYLVLFRLRRTNWPSLSRVFVCEERTTSCQDVHLWTKTCCVLQLCAVFIWGPVDVFKYRCFVETVIRYITYCFGWICSHISDRIELAYFHAQLFPVMYYCQYDFFQLISRLTWKLLSVIVWNTREFCEVARIWIWNSGKAWLDCVWIATRSIAHAQISMLSIVLLQKTCLK
jgi:hypothetical protein